MSDYTHGGDIYSYPGSLLDFSANISPLGLPQNVKSALIASMDHWDRYPDSKCRELRTALANVHAVPERYISCGNGAAELIYKVAQVIRPCRAMVTAPTFSEYRQALCSVGCGVEDYPLSEQHAFCLTEQFQTVLDQPLELLVLCNPNNPTGQPIDPNLLGRILEACAQKKIWILLDECFVPFLDDAKLHSQIGALSRYPNLIILRAFTKLYAMAGLRLGYLLCSNEALMRRIASCGQPWSVSAPAQAAGVAALKDTAYVDAVRRLIHTERAYLTGALQEIGMKVMGSKANYIFFKCPIKNLKERLLRENILIRSCANFHGLDKQFYRISVRTHEENKRLIAALTNQMAGGNPI